MPDVHEQRREALAKAQAVRQRKAALKRSLKSGSLTLEAALEHPDLQDWPAGEVIGFACIGQSRWKGNTQPKTAPHLALDLLHAARVGHSRPLRQVTLLERRLILARAAEKAQKRAADRRRRMKRLRRDRN